MTGSVTASATAPRPEPRTMAMRGDAASGRTAIWLRRYAAASETWSKTEELILFTLEDSRTARIWFELFWSFRGCLRALLMMCTWYASQNFRYGSVCSLDNQWLIHTPSWNSVNRGFRCPHVSGDNDEKHETGHSSIQVCKKTLLPSTILSV